MFRLIWLYGYQHFVFNTTHAHILIVYITVEKTHCVNALNSYTVWAVFLQSNQKYQILLVSLLISEYDASIESNKCGDFCQQF